VYQTSIIGASLHKKVDFSFITNSLGCSKLLNLDSKLLNAAVMERYGEMEKSLVGILTFF